MSETIFFFFSRNQIRLYRPDQQNEFTTRAVVFFFCNHHFTTIYSLHFPSWTITSFEELLSHVESLTCTHGVVDDPMPVRLFSARSSASCFRLRSLRVCSLVSSCVCFSSSLYQSSHEVSMRSCSLLNACKILWYSSLDHTKPPGIHNVVVSPFLLVRHSHSQIKKPLYICLSHTLPLPKS